MVKIKRDSVVAAPIIGGVAGVFSFFVLHSLAGLGAMDGDIAGMPLGLMVSLLLGVIVAAVVFGELLAQALEGK